VTSQSNSTAASIKKGKPETAYFRILLFDLGFLCPKGKVLGWCRLNPNHGKVRGVHPNSAATKEFALCGTPIRGGEIVDLGGDVWIGTR